MRQGERPEAPTPARPVAGIQVEFSREVAADALHDVRSEVRTLVEQWQPDPRMTNAVLDVAHELLANAHRHATPPVRLRVSATTDELRVEVRDSAKSPARVLSYRYGISERGLGLRLVRQLSTEWGQSADPTGKTVWARFVRRPPTR